MVAATLAAVSCGCRGNVSKNTTVKPTERSVALEATREPLLEKYNAMAAGVNTVNSTVELKTTAGSKYSGVIEEYH